MWILHSCDHTINEYRTNNPLRRSDTPHRDVLCMHSQNETQMRISHTPVTQVLVVHVAIQLKMNLVTKSDLAFTDEIIFQVP